MLTGIAVFLVPERWLTIVRTNHTLVRKQNNEQDSPGLLYVGSLCKGNVWRN